MATPQEGGRYAMEGNEGELQRLSVQHDLLTDTMGLVVEPVDLTRAHLRIIDSGTADGLWLRKLQESLKAPHKYIGADINPGFFPSTPVPGISFQIHSITQDWPVGWGSTFDYVHQRLVLMGAGKTSIEDCVSKLASLVKPGGWIELVEADLTGESTNGPVVQKFEAMTKRVFEMLGPGSNYVASLKDQLESFGLSGAEEKVFDVPYGAKCANAELAKKSVGTTVSASYGCLQILKGQFDVTDDFPDLLKEEMESQGAYFRYKAVWARKPAA